jgi:LmbE family N-acetylglucosaminyl deacetylase
MPVIKLISCRSITSLREKINMSDREKAEKVILERAMPGKANNGRVFIAVHSHLDDVPRYCAGTLAKLVREGYTGFIIRASNDEQRGAGSAAQNIQSCESEHVTMAAGLGIKGIFDLYYRDQCMNSISTQEFRFRLVLLFRYLKPDTVFSFPPWGEGEDDPDHRATGLVAEEACRMSGADAAYRELAEAGLRPHRVHERYYFVCRPGQAFNRVVDIGSTIEQKIAAVAKCHSGGGGKGSRLRAALAREGRRLAILGDNDQSADREYVRRFMMKEHEALGKRYGVRFAEAFYYVDQRASEEQAEVDKYVKENAIPLR